MVWIFFGKIKNSEININTQISNKYFKYQNPKFLLKDKVDNAKKVRIVNRDDALIDLGNPVK